MKEKKINFTVCKTCSENDNIEVKILVSTDNEEKGIPNENSEAINKSEYESLDYMSF